MTFRAVLIGLLFGAAMAAGGYLNDWALKLSLLANNLVPAGIYGLLVVGLLVVNPLLGWLRVRPLAAAEWAVVVALMTVAAVIPGPGLLWQFNDVLVMPHAHAERLPGWQRHDLLGYAPDGLLVDASTPEQKQVAVRGFVDRVERWDAETLAALWRAWRGPLAFWMPLVLLAFGGAVCMAAVVHPQWSRRENLRYPVVEFANTLLGGAEGGPWGGVFGNRLFWLGLLAVLAVLTINGLAAWFPGFIEIPLELSFFPAAQKWPKLMDVHRWYWLLKPRVFFVGLAFAYFLPSEIGLSVGISHFAFALFQLLVWPMLGMQWQWYPLEGGFIEYMNVGAYLGAAAVLLYTGRRHYLDVLLAAVGSAGVDRPPGLSVWGARLGVLCAVGMVAQLHWAAGLDWLPAAMLVAAMALMFLVLTRIHAESGVIVIQPNWWLITPLMGLFGGAALGPHAVLVLALVSAALAMDPRASMMPMVTNAFRLGEKRGVKPSGLSGWIVAMIVLALLVGVPATLWVQYSFTQAEGHFEWGRHVGGYAFDVLERNLLAGGFDAPSPAVHQGLDLSRIEPAEGFGPWLAAGFLLVVGTGAMRLRYTWWPVHPLLFLIWTSDTTRPLVWSFLIGWLIRSAVASFGTASYRKYRPLFVGIAAGEFLAGLAWAAAGAGYYLATGYSAPVFRVHPF